MGRKKMPGLRKRGDTWHIEKQIKGFGMLYESTGSGTLQEAERYLAHRLEEIRQQTVYGVRPVRTFRQATTKYLEETFKRSIGRDAQALKIMDSHLGDLPLTKVHMGTLQPYLQARRRQGIKSGTVSRELAVVRRILNLAARMWRDECDRPWLDAPPMIELPDWEDDRSPYPLSWSEQITLFKELPAHLARMALFKVNTGTREQEVCGLRWDWEVQIPELNTSVFILPGVPTEKDWKGTKNKEDRIVVLNRVARSVIEEVRGQHPMYVFTYKGTRVKRMMNSAWRHARKKVALDQVRVHDLKHTFGRRLRSAGVHRETRKILLGHTDGDITTHYSAPELEELIAAAEKVCGDGSGKNPALVILKRNAVKSNAAVS